MRFTPMKRILFYTDTPIFGGAERQMALLSRYLPNEEYELSLACSGNKTLNALCQRFMEDGRAVYRLRVAHKHDPRHLTGLIKLLRRENFDLLHLHLWNPASCRYGFLAATVTGTPVIVTEHDPFKLGRLKFWMKRKFMRQPRRIIAISDANKKMLTQEMPEIAERTRVVHNGIDVDWWKSQQLGMTTSDRDDLRDKEFSAKPEDAILMSVGELHPRKGHQTLIQAFPEIKKKHPNTKLVIVGDGPERDKYKKKIAQLGLEDSIILLGQRSDVPKLLVAADIFIHPSHREAFGFVILEALVSGLPTVATRVGGIPELIEDGKTGSLIRSEDLAALARSVCELLEQREMREELAHAGQERVDHYFSAQTWKNSVAGRFECHL